MSTTHTAHKDEKVTPAEAEGHNPKRASKTGEIDEPEVLETPAFDQLRAEAPRTDGEAQAQAQEGYYVASRPEPVAYKPEPAVGQLLGQDEEKPDFDKISHDTVNNALKVNLHKVMSEQSSAIRQLIAAQMGWGAEGADRVGLRQAASDNDELVVEVRKDRDDWKKVSIDS